MKILVATDAWHPQVNGVVRTLNEVARAARDFGVTVEFITPAEFRSLPMPGYPEIRLAFPPAHEIERRIAEIHPDAIHVATEGPIGHAVRRYCVRRSLPFTTSFHTRFPDYVAQRLPVPPRWTWSWLRRFHGAASAVMAATPTLATELTERGFKNVKLWSRGVDANLFRPRLGWCDLALQRPIFLTVGRLAVEKNIPAFLSLDLPGTKLVVGDGPARAELAQRFPDAVFLGAMQGEGLAAIYAAADVFVFPSRTDTFGLVLLEALASGTPIAAFPVAAPRDVIGQSEVGALDEDLQRACLEALEVSREACRQFALTMSWEASGRSFVEHVTQAAKAGRARIPAQGELITA
ncbi:MAG TPA: glycosyltransferase family 1 protein [Pseudolabrys sp.]|nr:glycosyltransferase family 1 protein [Pseudolabrys sp.]